MYEDYDVPASVLSSGKVYVDRTTSGADKPPVGEVQRAVSVPIRDARDLPLSLETNGVKLVSFHQEDICFEDIDAVVSKYYPECCRLVKEHTGAKEVFAFDHNLRGSAVQSWMNKTGGQASASKPLDPQYLSPAAIVHGDYTVTSAPLRLKMLGQPPKANDTWKKTTGGQPLIHPQRVER